jgi:hypothetical protein
MRARELCAACLVAVVLAGCGGDDPGSGDTATEPRPGSAQRDVRAAVNEYVDALAGDDPAAMCEVLTDRAKAAVQGFLPSTDTSDSCETVAKRLARRSVPLRRVKVDRISVSGQIATARINSRSPPYESAVQLTNEDGGWKISYPPGVVEKFRTPPGVPIEK